MAKLNKCFDSCLFWVGKGGLESVQTARIERTRLFFEDRTRFLSLLCEDIETIINKAKKEGQKAAIRLNGLSDIQWEKIKIPGRKISIIESYPDVQFYDYTKIFKRLGNTPCSYHLTFSHSEHYAESNNLARQALERGFNVTMIFPVKKGAPIPIKSIWDYPIIGGDKHDLTFLYPSPSIIALRYKHPNNPSLRSK